jgi:polyhydroxyalkanoate synthesis regulator phasin
LWLLACAILSAGGSMAFAQEPPEDQQPTADLAQMKATEVGVRFTPRMAEVIGKKITEGMKGRYELDDRQAEEIQRIIGTQFMTFATKNAQNGRDLIEMMLETMIENDGRFPKDDAVQFAKLVRPMVPELQRFFTETSGKIGQKMTIKQRLKFTAEATAATAGLAIFENRMKRWEEGKVSDNANPFFDSTDDDPSKAGAEAEPEDPTEPPDHRRARQDVERWMTWQIDLDKQWGGYVDRAIEYYAFDESQKTAAKRILDECMERAQKIKTPQWRSSLMENRIAQRLSRGLSAEVSQGPFMYKLEAEYEKLRKPLTDMEKELKRRIDGLGTSQQRAAARETVRKSLEKKGVKQLPVN